MGKEYIVFEEKDPGIVQAAEQGDIHACFYLAGIYVGLIDKYGSDYADFEKALFWAEKCYVSNTEQGLLYYTQIVSLIGHMRRKVGGFDEETLEYFLSARDTLQKLQDSSISQSKVTQLYYENELDLGWILVSSSQCSFFNPEEAKIHFSNAYEIDKCSDALWGIGVAALHQDDHWGYYSYGVQAINTNNWYDGEMESQCLRMMGLLLQDNSYAVVGINKNLKQSFAYMKKAAELGDLIAKEELEHYKKGPFGQLKYV